MILLLPDANAVNTEAKFNSLEATVHTLVSSVENIRTNTDKNAAQILKLTSENNNLKIRNEHLIQEIEEFKAKENHNLINLQEDLQKINNQINEIEQYLR